MSGDFSPPSGILACLDAAGRFLCAVPPRGDLARQNPGSSYLSSDRFHLNDLGYRCMAEYAARAIVSGILQADAEGAALH